MATLERRPTSGISSSSTVNVLTIKYLGMVPRIVRHHGRQDEHGWRRRLPVRSDELRALQTPIKARYRKDPGAASITLRAEGELGSEDVSCSVATGRALVEAGLHPASGGDGSLACSGDMLLQALVACAGVTLRAVAANRGIEVRGSVRAEGDLDFRGTLGIDRSAPVGFRSIRLAFDLQSD